MHVACVFSGANARLEQTLAVRSRASVEPARPCLEGLGGGGYHMTTDAGSTIGSDQGKATGLTEAERVARLLQAEVTEMRTVIERLEADKRQVSSRGCYICVPPYSKLNHRKYVLATSVSLRVSCPGLHV